MHGSRGLGRWERAGRAAAALAGVTLVAVTAVLAAGVSAWAQAGGGARAPCRFDVAQKLGLPFYRVCGEAPDAPAFWISGPIACSKGENGQVQCPHATPLVHGRGVRPATVAAREVAMVDGFTAHRICGMRFAGRLPTRGERVAARDTLGLATMIATQAGEQSDSLTLTELPEWVSEGTCNNPSAPGSGCRLSTYPPAPTGLPLAWDALRACEAVLVPTLRDETAPCTLGVACEGRGGGMVSGAKSGVTSLVACPGKESGAYALRCDKPAVTVHAAAPREPLAAVRCVLDDSALGRAAASALGR